MLYFILIFLLLFVVVTSAVLFIVFYKKMHHPRKKTPVNGLDDATRNPDYLYKALLEYFANDKPYLDPNLKIGDVTQRLLTNRTYLSRAIRENKMVNFNYFVNSYRIREAIDIFRMDPMARVGETGVKCGFNTTASFTMAFKAYLNLTPKQWKDYYLSNAVSQRVKSAGLKESDNRNKQYDIVSDLRKAL